MDRLFEIEEDTCVYVRLMRDSLDVEIFVYTYRVVLHLVFRRLLENGEG